MRNRSFLYCAAACLLAGPLATSAAIAQETATRDQDTRRDAGESMDTKQQVEKATKVVARMKRDPKLTQLLQQAHGVFIVPTYGKAAAVVGGRGGEGVLLVRDEDEWSSPAFYNFGSLSVGAQAGGAGGSIAMLLMNDKAANTFKTNKDNFSLDARAGLTIVDYTAEAEATADKSDVIVWSDAKGLFAGASIGVTGVRRDDSDNREYYKRQASTQEILSGAVTNPHAQSLRDALPDRMAAR